MRFPSLTKTTILVLESAAHSRTAHETADEISWLLEMSETCERTGRLVRYDEPVWGAINKLEEAGYITGDRQMRLTDRGRVVFAAIFGTLLADDIITAGDRD
jgi:hypothetical protein